MRFIFLLSFILTCFACNKIPKKRDENKFVIGFAQCTMADRWRTTMVREMNTEIDIFDKYTIELIIKDANNSNEKQINDIKELISEGIDLLIVSPNESKPVTPIVEEIYNSGIPVIIIDRKIESDKYTAFIGADKYIIGEQAGIFALELLNNSGCVIEIAGLAGSSPTIHRHEGFLESIKQNKNIKVCATLTSDWTEANAFELLDNYLNTKHSPFDLVYAHNDYMALGAYKALKKSKKQHIPIIGIDGLYGPEQGIVMVNEGILAGTFLYPTGGDIAIQVAMNILTQNQYAKNNLLKTTRIDQSNAKTVLLQSDHIIDQQYKIDKQRALVSNQRTIISKQQTRLLLFYLLAFLLASIAFVFVYTFYMKNKSNKILREKNRKIEKQNEQIIDQRNKLIDMVKIAENATETKLQFFTNISHEFRTLISLISLPVKQILEEYKGSTEINETLKNIDQNADRLVELSEEVLDFRKIEKNSYKLNLQPHDLKIVLNNRIEGFVSMAGEKGIKIVFNGKELVFDFDQRIIEKIFNNVLSNAIKYSPRNETILVRFESNEKLVTIIIEDFGPGIPDEKLTSIFNRFEQHDFNKDLNLFGSGIGLAYTQELITFHEGQIKLSNKQNGGLISEITFPYRINSENEEELETEQSQSNYKDVKGEKPTVLIAEDNDHLRRIIKKTLEKDYHVLEAVNGKIALQILEKTIPDIVVSDILMPKMDGIQLCQKIKTTPSIADLPVILLTALATHESTIEGFDTGADAYITKPFNQNILKSRIKNLLQNKERIKEHFYKMSQVKSVNAIGLYDKDFIDEVRKNIEKQIDNQNLTIETIAEKMNMSHSTLYRNLKKATGMRSVDFIKLIRLENAARMLLTTRFNVEEICYLNGFTDPKYFRKCFIKQFEKTPSEFRKNGVV
jgi:ABC-type sugar transport system substrate-binding protein/DNA-binding response OmpR family regulator